MEISSDVVRERQKYIKSVTQFIQEKQERLDKVLKRLGLSDKELLKGEEKKVCPYNKDHIVHGKYFDKHIESCRLLFAGYQKDELPALLQDVDFCYKNADSIMKIEIDDKLLNKIIWDHSVQNGQVYTGHRTMPVSYIDENIMLTQEDRLAIYKYVVKKSHEAGKVIPVDRSDELLTTDWSSLVKKGLLDEQNNKQYSSKLEQLAALRDLKRRRQSYRAKNVHITKKSYTEIIREVICNQMEILVPGNSSDVVDSTNQEPTENKSEESNSRHDSRERDKWNDNNPGERGGKRREYDDSEDKRRSKDEDGRVSTERYRHSGRSEDRRRERSEDRYGERSEDRHGDRSEERRSYRSSRDMKQSKERGRDRDVTGVHDKDSTANKDKPRRFTEADDVMLTEIKKESLINDNEGNVTTSVSGDVIGCEIPKEELESTDGNYTSKSDRTRKRSRSNSESSNSKHSGKRKKSKHKKKHGKKHKRRD